MRNSPPGGTLYFKFALFTFLIKPNVLEKLQGVSLGTTTEPPVSVILQYLFRFKINIEFTFDFHVY